MAIQLGPFFTADNTKIFLSINHSGFVECLWKSIHDGWEEYKPPQTDEAAIHLFVYAPHHTGSAGASHCIIIAANNPLVFFTLANRGGHLIPMGQMLRPNGTWDPVDEKRERIRAENYKTETFEITLEKFYQPSEETKLAIRSEQEEICLNYDHFQKEHKKQKEQQLTFDQENKKLAIQKAQTLVQIRESEEREQMSSEDHSWQFWQEIGRFEPLDTAFEQAIATHKNLNSQQIAMIIAYISPTWMTLKQETNTSEEYHQALLNILRKKCTDEWTNAYNLYRYTLATSINQLGKMHFYALETKFTSVPAGSPTIADVHAFIHHAIQFEIIALEKKYTISTQLINIHPLPISERIHYIGELPITHVNQPESLSSQADEQLTHLTAAFYLNAQQTHRVFATHHNAVINYSNQLLAQQSNEYLIGLIELAITIGERSFTFDQSSAISDNLVALINPEIPQEGSFDLNEAIAQKIPMQLAFKLLERTGNLELIQSILKKIKKTDNYCWETLLSLLSPSKRKQIYWIVIKQLSLGPSGTSTANFPLNILNFNEIELSYDTLNSFFYSPILFNFNKKSIVSIIKHFINYIFYKCKDELVSPKLIDRLQSITIQKPEIEDKILDCIKTSLQNFDYSTECHLVLDKMSNLEKHLKSFDQFPCKFTNELLHILSQIIKQKNFELLLTKYQNIQDITISDEIFQSIPNLHQYKKMASRLTEDQKNILAEIFHSKLLLFSIAEINNFFILPANKKRFIFTVADYKKLEQKLPPEIKPYHFQPAQEKDFNFLEYAENQITFPLSEELNDFFVFLRHLIIQYKSSKPALFGYNSQHVLISDDSIQQSLQNISLDTIQQCINYFCGDLSSPPVAPEVSSIIKYLLADSKTPEYKSEYKYRLLINVISDHMKKELNLRLKKERMEEERRFINECSCSPAPDGTPARFNLARFFEILPDIRTFKEVFPEPSIELIRTFLAAVEQKIHESYPGVSKNFSEAFGKFKILKQVKLRYPNSSHEMGILFKDLSQDDAQRLAPKFHQYIYSTRFKSLDLVLENHH